MDDLSDILFQQKVYYAKKNKAHRIFWSYKKCEISSPSSSSSPNYSAPIFEYLKNFSLAAYV